MWLTIVNMNKHDLRYLVDTNLLPYNEILCSQIAASSRSQIAALSAFGRGQLEWFEWFVAFASAVLAMQNVVTECPEFPQCREALSADSFETATL